MIEVKLKHISQDKFGFKSRIVSIKLKKMIQTPNRAITNYEIYKKRKLPTQIHLKNDIVFHAEPVLSPDFPINRRSIASKINSFETLHGDLVKIHELIIPCIWPKKDLLKNVNFVRKLMNIIVVMFAESDAEYGYKIVGIPPLYGVTLSEYRQILKDVKGNFNKYNMEILPIFALDYNFESLVEYAVKDLNLSLIGFKYGQIKNYVPQYLFMRNYYADKDVAFMSVNTKRYENIGVSDFAVMHLLPFTGADLFVSWIGPFGWGGKLVPSLRVLDRQNLRLPLLMTLDERQRDEIFREFLKLANIKDVELEKVVEVLSKQEKLKKVIERIIQLLNSKQRDKIKMGRELCERINSLTRIQEVIASSKELYELQQYIKQDDVNHYLKNRPNLKMVGQRVNIAPLS